MFVIIGSDERDLCLLDTADTKEDANNVIYRELLDLYDGDAERMNEDIENEEAGIDDLDMSAWSNRHGNHDIKAFWV